ncbi:serine hydrolase domain-containing protein [Fodinicola feengrottensis]|uniref:serine hydrolase domain-containing protein n=1 Tax=Fodinicola feengrottensis TaxID=435914 RepID=UPI002442A34D|nr:serine hydrolase [Fodinicola feengrottensis]
MYHAGQQRVICAGYANTAARIDMTQDTGFPLGSITKAMTTTLVMRYVERGEIDLDGAVTAYLPDLTLQTPGHVDTLRVRHLLNHTHGIDGTGLMPSAVRGRDAVKSYVDALAGCGTLFPVEQFVSYSNPGFSIAGRILEVVTGIPFTELLERELYEPVGMADSATSAEQAIMRRTAVGHTLDRRTGTIRPVDLFALPPSGAAAGSTAVVTIADLLAFARTHLANGRSPSGRRVLSAEFSALMRTVTHDMQTPNIPPIGYGWWLLQFGSTVAMWHIGGTPGCTSHLIVLPDYDFAFAAFGSGPGAPLRHERHTLWLLRDYLGLEVPVTVTFDAATSVDDAAKLAGYAGTYRTLQYRHDVRTVEGHLEHSVTFEPMDSDHARLGAYAGGPQPTKLAPVSNGIFAPADRPAESFTGPFGRMNLVSFHGTTPDGHPSHVGRALALARRDT